MQNKYYYFIKILPEVATSCTSRPSSPERKPKMENIINPAQKLVNESETVTMNVSLKHVISSNLKSI